MTQFRLLKIVPRSHSRTQKQFIRFKHSGKTTRKKLADKSKEQIAQQLADTKRKLRELKNRTAEKEELTQASEVEPEIKIWQFWKSRNKAVKISSEPEIQKEEDPPAVEPKKKMRTAKEHSQKIKSKQSHWTHRMTTDPQLSKSLEEYEELRIQVEEAERKYAEKKAKGKPVKIHENARVGLRLMVHGEQKNSHFRFPKFLNRAIPLPNVPVTAARRRELDDEQDQRDQEREEKNKDQPRKYKKYFAIPLIIWIYDWFRKKDKVRKIAKKVQAPFEIEMVQLRRILRLSNDELLQFHAWLCDHEKTYLTVDEFGLEFAKAVAHFHLQISPSERPVVSEALQEAPPADGEFRVRRNELFPWDIAFMWRKLDVSCQTTIPLWKFFTGISHYVYNDLEQKGSVGFLVLDYEKGNENGVAFNDVCELMNVMVDTGHFESEAFIERTSWLPHQFILRDQKRMAEVLFTAAGLDPEKDRINITQFEKALLDLGWSKWYEFGRPEMRTWYTTKGKQKLIKSRDQRLEKERKQKEEEERAAQSGDTSYSAKLKAYLPFTDKQGGPPKESQISGFIT